MASPRWAPGPLGRVRAIAVVAALIAGCAELAEVPVAVDGPRGCVQLVFHDAVPGSVVSVVGVHNGWTSGVDVLTDPDGDGLYVGAVRFDPGLGGYLIDIDGARVMDAYEPLGGWDAGLGREVSLRAGQDCAAPRVSFASLTASGDGSLVAELAWSPAEWGEDVEPGEVVVGVDEVDTAAQVEVVGGADGVVLRVTAHGLAPGKHHLVVEARDAAGRAAPLQRAPFWVEPEPFTWRDAVIYQIFVDRFRRGGGALDDEAPITFYHGGDLWGVLEAIEDGYFESLGANVLWLSPVYENPDGTWLGRVGVDAEAYHGYWPVEPRAVETRFGGEAALDAVVTAAHARGMRVIADVVLNHVHWEHPYHRRGRDWLNHPDADCICGSPTCSWGEHIQVCWFDPYLPDLDWRNPTVADQLTEDAVWWLERFDLDGLRLDAVPMMPRYAMRQLRHRVESSLNPIATHTYLLGETYTGRGEQGLIRYYLGPHTLSGQFDFPVMWALRDALSGRGALKAVADEVAASQAAWEGSGAVMAPLLGNHDVPRFVSDVHGDVVWSPGEVQPPPDSDQPYEMLKIGWSFVLTQPGAPVIYNGDEYGEPGAHDPDNRRNTRFGDALDAREHRVLEHVRRLGHARRCSRALRRGELAVLTATADLYVYGRGESGESLAVVALNTSSVAQTVDIALPDGWVVPDGWQPADVVGGAAPTLDDGHLQLEVPARGSVVLVDAGCGG